MIVPASTPAPTVGARLVQALRRAMDAGRTSGLAHYVAAMFSVQGLTYLTQLAIASVVGPADFGVVRTVEATLNVLLVVASVGMPMLAVTTMATLREEEAQGRMLATLLALSAAGGAFTAAAASLAAGLLPAPASAYLRALAWVMILSACSRTSLNYFLGRQQVRRVAAYTALLSLFSFGIVVMAVLTAGLSGWVGGRYLSEILFFSLLLRLLWPSLRFSDPIASRQTLRTLLTAGTGIALSLLVRTASDNAGVFLLNFAGAPGTTVGYFGLASLVQLGLLIIPTSLGSIALPRIVARLPDPSAVHRLVRRVAAGSLALSLVLAGGTATFARPVIDFLFPSYADVVPILWLLLLAVPFRALSALSGMVLVACDRVRLTVWINLIALVVMVLAGAAATAWWGAVGTACAVVASEVLAATAYIIVAWRSLPRATSTY